MLLAVNHKTSQSVLHDQESLEAVNQMCVVHEATNGCQKSKDLLKACFETVNIYKWHRPVHEIFVLNTSASSQGLDEPVHLHSVAIAFTARTHIGLDGRKSI